MHIPGYIALGHINLGDSLGTEEICDLLPDLSMMRISAKCHIEERTSAFGVLHLYVSGFAEKESLVLIPVLQLVPGLFPKLLLELGPASDHVVPRRYGIDPPLGLGGVEEDYFHRLIPLLTIPASPVSSSRAALQNRGSQDG
jgi:hypothetical protein